MQETLARLGGAAITSALLARAAALLISDGHALPWAGALLFAAAPAVTLAFALPVARLRTYLRNALVVLLVTTIWLGFHHRSVDEDVTAEVAFVEGFTLSFIDAGSGLVAGGLALAVAGRRARRRT